uniref:Uncharacterized protein n=1 Tax=Chrysotila carterae TaxID=13221 RepID=A0A7S4BKY6_CHRCT
MYVHTHASTRERSHAAIPACTHAHRLARTRTHTSTPASAQTHRKTHAHLQAAISAHTRTRAHLRTARAQTCTFACTHARSFNRFHVREAREVTVDELGTYLGTDDGI